MNCKEYQLLLEKRLIDGVTEDEQTAMAAHEQECPACAALDARTDDLQNPLEALSGDVPPMPEDLHAAWMARVEEEHMNGNRKKLSHTAWTRILSAAAALVFVVAGTLLTRDKMDDPVVQKRMATEESAAYDYYGTDMVYMTSEDTTRAAGLSTNAPTAKQAATDQKIIRTVSLTLGTRTYEDSLLTIRSACEEMGGWVSYVSESTDDTALRSASLTLRIPTEKLDGYLGQIGGSGRVIFREEMANDVTEAYQDTQAQLDTQLALMDRLLALMDTAGSLSDLLALETQIAQTQYTIDYLRDSLNNTDEQVAYATVHVYLREESSADSLQDKQASFGERLADALKTGAAAFVDFMADCAVFLTAALPFILVAAAAYGVIWLIIRLLRKKR